MYTTACVRRRTDVSQLARMTCPRLIITTAGCLALFWKSRGCGRCRPTGGPPAVSATLASLTCWRADGEEVARRRVGDESAYSRVESSQGVGVRRVRTHSLSLRLPKESGPEHSQRLQSSRLLCCARADCHNIITSPASSPVL